jgi:hypothetical protein
LTRMAALFFIKLIRWRVYRKRSSKRERFVLQIAVVIHSGSSLLIYLLRSSNYTPSSKSFHRPDTNLNGTTVGYRAVAYSKDTTGTTYYVSQCDANNTKIHSVARPSECMNRSSLYRSVFSILERCHYKVTV